MRDKLLPDCSLITLAVKWLMAKTGRRSKIALGKCQNKKRKSRNGEEGEKRGGKQTKGENFEQFLDAFRSQFWHSAHSAFSNDCCPFVLLSLPCSPQPPSLLLQLLMYVPHPFRSLPLAQLLLAV